MIEKIKKITPTATNKIIEIKTVAIKELILCKSFSFKFNLPVRMNVKNIIENKRISIIGE